MMEKISLIIVAVLAVAIIIGSVLLYTNSNNVIETTLTMAKEDTEYIINSSTFGYGLSSAHAYYHLYSPDLDRDILVKSDTKIINMYRESETWAATIRILPYGEYSIIFSNGYKITGTDGTTGY